MLQRLQLWCSIKLRVQRLLAMYASRTELKKRSEELLTVTSRLAVVVVLILMAMIALEVLCLAVLQKIRYHKYHHAFKQKDVLASAAAAECSIHQTRPETACISFVAILAWLFFSRSCIMARQRVYSQQNMYVVQNSAQHL
jgi:hypothetical protein